MTGSRSRGRILSDGASPRVKRCGSSISSKAEKLLEWPLCGVAGEEQAMLEASGKIADGARQLA